MQNQECQINRELKRSRLVFVLVVIIFLISFNFISYNLMFKKVSTENQVTGGVVSVLSNSIFSGVLTFLNIVFLSIFRFIYYIWSERPKKGQAALEFIMTYGWVILVVTIFVTSLFYINSINIQKSPTSQGCFLFPGLSCEEYKVDTAGISLVVRNGLGEDLSYLNIIALNDENYCNNVSLNSTSILSDGNVVKLNNTCLFPPIANQIFRSDLEIIYRISGKSILHKQKGYIITKVENAFILTNGTCLDGTPLNSCSVTKPGYCNVAGQLIENCNVCSCNAGLLCNSGSGSCYSTNYCPDGITQYQSCSNTKPVYCTSVGLFSNNCNICGCPGSYSNCNITSNKCYDILSNGTKLYIANTFSDIYPSKSILYTPSDLSDKTVYINISKSISLVSAVMNVAGEKLISFRTNANSESFGLNTWISLDSYKSGFDILQNGTLRGYGFNGNSTFNGSTLYLNACNNAVFLTGLKTPLNHNIYYQEGGSGTFIFIDANDDGICANDPVFKLNYDGAQYAVLTQGGVEPYTSNNQETFSYPSNVLIDLGSNGSNEFSKLGIYSTVSQFDFRSALSSYLQNSCSGGTCSVPLVVKSSSSGKVTLSDITITYYGL